MQSHNRYMPVAQAANPASQMAGRQMMMASMPASVMGAQQMQNAQAMAALKKNGATQSLILSKEQ